MDKIDVSKEVKLLVKKAAEAESPNAAQQFAQAACNAANAMATVNAVAGANGDSKS